jgi:lysozyme
MIEKVLILEEGYRENAYHCSEGYPTIGIGKKIGPKNAGLKMYQFKCSKEMALLWLREEIKIIRDKLIRFPWYVNLNSDRQDIIKSMAYQIGVRGLLKFKKMIAALDEKDWDKAADEALNSKWAKQTPNRALRHSEVLRYGNLSDQYDLEE